MNYTRTQSQEIGYLRLLFDLIFEEEPKQPKDAGIFKNNQQTNDANVVLFSSKKNK